MGTGGLALLVSRALGLLSDPRRLSIRNWLKRVAEDIALRAKLLARGLNASGRSPVPACLAGNGRADNHGQASGEQFAPQGNVFGNAFQPVSNGQAPRVTQ